MLLQLPMWVAIFLYSRELNTKFQSDTSLTASGEHFKFNSLEWRNIVTHGQLKDNLYLLYANMTIILCSTELKNKQIMEGINKVCTVT